MNRDQLMQLPELKNFKGKVEIVKVWSDGNKIAVLARGSFHLHMQGVWYQFGPHNLEDFVMMGDRALALNCEGFLLSQPELMKEASKTSQVFLNIQSQFHFVEILIGIKFVKMAIGENRYFAMAQDGGLYEWTSSGCIVYELDGSLIDKCNSEPPNKMVTQLLCTKACPMVLSSCGKVFIPLKQLSCSILRILPKQVLKIFGKNLTGKKVVELAAGEKFSFALTNSGELYKWNTCDVYRLQYLQMLDYKCHAYQSRGTMIWASNTMNLVVILLESGSYVSIRLTESGDILAISTISSISVGTSKILLNGCLYNGVRKLRNTGIKDMWLGKLEAIFNKEDASDLIIEAEGKPIHCHKSFVSAHSEYIKNWIKNEGVKENAGEKLRLCSKDLKYETLRTILNYFYTGKLEFHSFDITLNLIEVTEMWVEKELQNFFVDQAIQNLSFENVHLAKKIADKLEIEVLKKACFSHSPDLYYIKA